MNFHSEAFFYTHLNASLSEVDAEAVRIPAVVIDELLQRPEGRPPRYEEASLVQLPDSVVLDGVAVPDWERVIVPPGLGVADEEGAVLVLSNQQLLLGLNPLDLAKVPSWKEKKFEHVSIRIIEKCLTLDQTEAS